MNKSIQRWWLARGPNAWAKAETIAKTIAECKREIPRWHDCGIIELFAVPPSAEVDELGNIRYTPGEPSPSRVTAYWWNGSRNNGLQEIPLDMCGFPLEDWGAIKKRLTKRTG